MKPMDEKTFYAALGDVPELSPRVFENVERHVRRSGVKRRTALAACLLLAFIIPVMVFKQVSNPSNVYAEEYESMDELLYAFEFLNGDNDVDWLLQAADAGLVNGGAVDNDDKLLSLSEKKAVANNGNRKERSNED